MYEALYCKIAYITMQGDNLWSEIVNNIFHNFVAFLCNRKIAFSIKARSHYSDSAVTRD